MISSGAATAKRNLTALRTCSERHLKNAYNGGVNTAATELLFRDDPYSKTCVARVLKVSERALFFDRTIFYPLGGGQPGDQGQARRPDGTAINIVNTFANADGEICHAIEEQGPVLHDGDEVELVLDWERRHAHMRMHTGLHLLGAVVPFGVTGGNISATRSRLDFDMQDGLDKEPLTASLNALVTADHPVLSRWITQDELAAQPELVRTMSVRPPANVAKLRLLEIPGVDLQPCGGTHLRSTAEVGAVRIGKVEKKGRQNRRVNIHLDD